MEQLGHEESTRLLKKYGIALPKSEVVKSEGEAVSAAARMGYPVVMKIHSSSVLHKSDVGGVRLGVASKGEAAKAYGEIMGIRGAEGAIVQKFYEGHWVLVGMKRDAQFGPVLAFGLGGVFVEVMKDVVFRIAPVSVKEAKGMVREIKGYKVLEGARGGLKANVSKIVSTIVKVSRLAMREKDVKEIDLNPIVVNSKEAVPVDVRILR